MDNSMTIRVTVMRISDEDAIKLKAAIADLLQELEIAARVDITLRPASLAPSMM